MTKVLVSNIAQKISEKVLLIPISILHMKSIANTIAGNANTVILINNLYTNRQQGHSYHTPSG